MTINFVNYRSFYPSIRYYNSVLNYFISVFNLFKKNKVSELNFRKLKLKMKYK